MELKSVEIPWLSGMMNPGSTKFKASRLCLLGLLDLSLVVSPRSRPHRGATPRGSEVGRKRVQDSRRRAQWLHLTPRIWVVGSGGGALGWSPWPRARALPPGRGWGWRTGPPKQKGSFGEGAVDTGKLRATSAPLVMCLTHCQAHSGLSARTGCDGHVDRSQTGAGTPRQLVNRYSWGCL